jgi:hypothetical protein
MNHSTSRDATRGRALTRRGFLGNLASGALALGAVALPLSHPSTTSPDPHLTPVDETPLMTGAEYVALLRGAACEKIYDEYIENRWTEVANGPLIEAIDSRALVICSRCLFVSYASVPCQVCLQWGMVKPEDVTEYLASLRENYESLPETIEEFLGEQRIERAVDLIDGPESAENYGQTLYIRDLLKTRAAV